jgi:error-prone DNA polymerase
MASEYASLWCKSNYSFLEGASHPEELVETAGNLGLTAIGLTDRDGVYGTVEAHTKARELGVKLILGSEITLDDDSTIALLATDRDGWKSLCRLITEGRRRSEKGESRVRWDEVCAHAEGLVALWGGRRSLLAHTADPVFVAHDLRDAFGDRLYAMVTRHKRADETSQEARLRERAGRYRLPLVAAHEVLYHKKARRDLQDVLTCIRHGVKLSEAGRRTNPNAEHALKTSHAFNSLFHDLPTAVAATLDIAARCDFGLDALRYVYPSEALPDGQTSSGRLRELTLRGALTRYGGAPSTAVHEQLDKELALIDELDYCGYFLTMWEIVRFCREQGILCQGRGSAANSAVCYCLGITAVDPISMGLLFERFLSRERAEPPDIDLDIEHERREEVIQHVYAKYGRKHAAMVCNFIRYRARSAVRDVGKVLGVAETALDRFSKLLSHHGSLRPELMQQAGLEPEHPMHRHMFRLTAEILDFPRHLSIHPGGFLLGHEPVHDIVPIENASMPDRTVIQWDKDCLEELGLFKVDLLGLGAMHQLHLSFDLLKQHYDLEHGMATLPQGDVPTYDMICKGDTIGVFQIESRAQMAMLPRLKPRTYYDLVIEVSIVRPGPITGGMVHPYLRRRSGEEPVEYPHSCLEPVLKKTLGVPLFQEQVIRLAMVAADYTPGEADQLRRDMAAWRRSGRIERHHARLVQRMTAKGITEEFAERVFEQIRGFGEYGFPESHAASFALIAYATAWMKRHHHDVFTCSLLNAQPMGFYSTSTIVEDAKRHGVAVLPVDVRASDWHCTLEPAPDPPPMAIRMGLRYVKGLAKASGEKILAERAGRPYESIERFVERTRLDEGSLTRLAESGAFQGFDADRRSAIWRVRGESRAGATEIGVTDRERLPGFDRLGTLETINWDYRSTGHSPRGHPLGPLRDRMRKMQLPDAGTLNGMRDGKRVRYAGMVICRQRPGTASGVVFMTLEDETGFVNLVVWDKVFREHTVLIKTTSFIGVTGKIQARDGVTHVIADSFWIPRLRVEVASGGSHDFH